MWYPVENGEAVRPSRIDQTSSAAYVYVRRNVALVEGGGDIPTHYVWEETKVPKDDWEIYQMAYEASQNAETNGDAIADLSEIVSETDVSVSDILDAIADLSYDVSALYEVIEGGETA